MISKPSIAPIGRDDQDERDEPGPGGVEAERLGGPVQRDGIEDDQGDDDGEAQPEAEDPMVAGIELDGQVGLVLLGVRFGHLGLVGASGQFPEVDAGSQGVLDRLGHRRVFLQQALDRGGRVSPQFSVGMRCSFGIGLRRQVEVVVFGFWLALRLAMLDDGFDSHLSSSGHGLKEMSRTGGEPDTRRVCQALR